MICFQLFVCLFLIDGTLVFGYAYLFIQVPFVEKYLFKKVLLKNSYPYTYWSVCELSHLFH